MAGGTGRGGVPRRRPRPGRGGGTAPQLALFTGDNDLAAREAEARWLARQVAEAAAGLKKTKPSASCSSPAPICRIYLQALYEPGLAVRVREGLKLADSRVVQHLHNLARALVRPQDEVAWAAALRGPWGPQVPLRILARVALTPGDLGRRNCAGLPESDAPRNYRADAAAAARAQVGRRPLAEILADWLG